MGYEQPTLASDQPSQAAHQQCKFLEMPAAATAYGPSSLGAGAIFAGPAPFIQTYRLPQPACRLRAASAAGPATTPIAMPTERTLPFLTGAAVRQDCSARLLVLIAKVSLNDEQKAEARRLATGVTDWPEFARLAAEKFVASYANRHLRAMAADIVPPSILATLHQLARKGAISALRVAAAQVAFHNDCIASTGARHAYLKGVALAAQYKRDLGERPCRDIDVLIAKGDFRSVLKASQAAGYNVYLDISSGALAESPADFDFLARYADDVIVTGPHAIPIEVHQRLDKAGLPFDLDLALSSAVEVSLLGVHARTLSKPLHFNYVCYHHSRHFWSKLHWLADLAAMVGDPDFDLAAVTGIANSLGIRPTLDAALEFSKLISRPDLWPPTGPSNTGGGKFLRACLYNIDGDQNLENSLRKRMPSADFTSMWQVSSERRFHFWLNASLNRLRPKPGQHARRRLPPYLHWVYYLRNAAALAGFGAR